MWSSSQASGIARARVSSVMLSGSGPTDARVQCVAWHYACAASQSTPRSRQQARVSRCERTAGFDRLGKLTAASSHARRPGRHRRIGGRVGRV